MQFAAAVANGNASFDAVLPCDDIEVMPDAPPPQRSFGSRFRNFTSFWMLLEIAAAVVFAVQRDIIGAVFFAVFAVGTGVRLVARIPFRIRAIARLYRSAAIFTATSVAPLVVAIDLIAKSRWTEATIFFCLALVLAAVTTTLIGFTRKANRTLRDREESS
jgi:hypothetical protein